MEKKEIRTEQAVSVITGLAVGATAHQLVLELQRAVRGDDHIRGNMGSKELGAIATALALFMPMGKVKYFIGGAGVGVTASSLISDYLTKTKQGFEPLSLADTTSDLIRKHSKWVHINPRLPLPQKEALVLPLFPGTIIEQRENPLQDKALKEWIRELKLGPRLTLKDMYKARNWFLKHGHYVADEGLFPGHDRYRTLSKLMRSKKKGWMEFDCDDASLSLCQLMDFYRCAWYFVLISQRAKADGVHPLHHVVAGMALRGTIWFVEGIKSVPILPIRHMGSIYTGLKRVTIVYRDGRYTDYEDWKYAKKEK